MNMGVIFFKIISHFPWNCIEKVLVGLMDCLIKRNQKRENVNDGTEN